STLSLGAGDSGETWRFDPASGLNSAVLDGGGSVDLITLNDGANDITIDGLKLQNFNAFGIVTFGAHSGLTIENCDVGFNTATSWSSGGIVIGNTVDSTIANNFVHDTGGSGIGLFAYFAGDSLNGDVVTGNVVLRSSERITDAGGIYVSMSGSTEVSFVTI